jgi:D-tyrosyl-tRNA(Tyr) deacylase
MRMVIQRTTQARVLVGDTVIAEIGMGMLVLAGVARSDSHADADYLAKRVHDLRIFADNTGADNTGADDRGKMNLDLKQVAGSVLLLPNFTLYGDCSKGRRPGFDLAARPEAARPLFDYLVEAFVNNGTPTKAGVFGAHMKVELVNDGPVTFVVDSVSRFRSSL